MTVHETAVLVVGAGPAGLAAAIALARSGAEVTIVDRRDERSTHPRATTISTRTMELLRGWGLEPAVRAAGVDVDWLLWRCETLALVDDGVAVEVGLPTRAQAALISPTAPACVSQTELERIMLDHARTLSSARVVLGRELVHLEQRGDGVRALLRHGDGGESVVDAGYVIGADGARSAVREALGIGLVGPDDVLGGVSALLRAPIWPLLGRHRYGIYAANVPGAESLFLPAGPGDRWGFGYIDPAGAAASLPDAAALVARIRRTAGVADLPVELERIGSFASAAQLAERFRDDRVFLVGDAAHRVTPRGGTGLNTAIHDGFDLGWKLAWVLAGWAGPELLDSYERERRPVAEHNVGRSADPEGSLRSPEDELRADLGGRIAHHWVRTSAGRASTLDLLGPGLTLFTGPRADLRPGWAGGPPVVHRPLDPLTARALGLRDGGALLVRPDGTPQGAWPEAASIEAAPLALGLI